MKRGIIQLTQLELKAITGIIIPDTPLSAKFNAARPPYNIQLSAAEVETILDILPYPEVADPPFPTIRQKLVTFLLDS